MELVYIIIAAVGFSIWTIRPLYNFLAKNKYILLDQNENTMTNRIKAGLPAVLFYALIISAILVPATLNNFFQAGTATAIIVLEIILIFLLTRIDKFQTKYSADKNGITYRRRFIPWNHQYTVLYKKTWLMVLHKPRFIIKGKSTKIVIPVLSKNISSFISELTKQDSKNGALCSEIIHNARLYYVKNPKIQKQLNKTV